MWKRPPEPRKADEFRANARRALLLRQSAELRENQKDQDSLPPYDVLDAILIRHVDQEQSREEIVAAGFDAATVDRVLKLVRISEWKRHQAAPGPKVSRRAFGRERRYPITNGYRE